MNSLKKAAIESVDSMAELYKDIANEIWDNPELSLKEYKAAELYCKVLKDHGFAVTEKLCGIDTAFCGSFGSGKPVIGILGEYDALSGLSQKSGLTHREALVPGGSGHGCGHNLLGVGSLAAAFAVKDYLQKSGHEGTVIFFGCPGEEGGSGKAFMAREKLWTKLDAALSWHPDSVNEVRTGTNNSSIQVLYKFKGVPAHAAGCPELGRSALDAVELMNIGVQFLREHMTDDCRIHYAITNTGGVSPNVVQPEAEVLYMVRANKVRQSVELQKRVDKIAEGAALMTETSYERVFIDGTAELLPNYTIEKLLYSNFEEIGVPQYSAEELEFAAKLKSTYPAESAAPGIGASFDADIAEKVLEKTENMTKPLYDFLMPQYSGIGFVAGSTDVGDVSWQTPTAQISVATWPSGMPGHTWQTVTCGKTSIAYKGMLCAGKVLAATAIDLMENDELLQEAKAEFEKRSAGGYVCPIEAGAKPIAL
ncbi:MAG: M20 family metallopeptidase [Oscillospiraceae bacterium]|nr:M20 family metallopeptidase [Oscillospiraceae bacterium]